jgi:hypothetical protein
MKFRRLFIWDYIEKLYLSKQENQEEIDKFLDIYDPQKLNKSNPEQKQLCKRYYNI